jgi:hypothetical protein
MLEVYIAGGYIAILLYAILLDNDGFREYMENFSETIIKVFKIKKTHPYTIMQMIGIMLLLCSWVGIVLLGLLIGDYLKYKNKEN